MQTAFPPRLNLPLIATEPLPHWEGFTASDAQAALPLEPQGEYSPTGGDARLELPAVSVELARRPVELLAPAGGPDAGFAAFHFGADAIYLGLHKFSARAEAENFTLDQVGEITAYAHSLTPRRRVFVTINTLIRQDELAELVKDIAGLEELGVDALIIQDLGVYQLVRRHFPMLELHASTQLSVHNRAGAEALHRLGFHRVVLARELTFEEVHDITAAAGIETEVFIHGALCYSYSGLCLFSSQTLGRSGNRGKCAYSCRDAFQVTGAPLTLRDGSPVRRDPQSGFPFSMKDLALPDHLPALRAAGVSCFKIEGRKKSPLYVATTTDYYRRLLDGRLDEAGRPAIEADLQTVFSRPWTRLFVQSHKDKEVADRDTVGHRGTSIGRVEAVLGAGTAEPRLRFRTRRNLERHDGLQVDLPTLGKPFGFAVEHLRVLTGGGRRSAERIGKPTYHAPAGSLVEVGLPREHPELPKGSPVYCSSSQAVKQKYRHERPKPGLHRSRKKLKVEVNLTRDELVATGVVDELCEQIRVPGPLALARDTATMEQAVHEAFTRLGDTRFQLASFTLHNEECRFVPVSKLNQARRALVERLEAKMETQQRDRVRAIIAAESPVNLKPPAAGFRWSIKVDRVAFLDAFDDKDWENVEEVVIDIARDHPTVLLDRVLELERRLGGLGGLGDLGVGRVRLALPPLTRAWEENGLRHKLAVLRQAGFANWEAGNLSAWSYLDLDPATADTRGLDLAADWSLYVVNRLAARQLLDMGVTRFCLSPEDGLANMRPLLAEFGPRAVVIVHQDTPLFLAESCAYANLIGGCPGKANCQFESMEMQSENGERVTALDYHCRTIVLNQAPFCLSPRLPELAQAGASSLRADFIYRKYEAEEVRTRWRAVRAGRPVPGGHAANFDRGVM
jgi:putative protease